MNFLISCTGDEFTTLATLVKTLIAIIQFAIPVVLIILGMLDLGKAVMSSKEDEIKKGQKTFISRLLAAVIIFFIITIVKIILKVLPASVIGKDTLNCIDQFI